jgi:hypothetical protein
MNNLILMIDCMIPASHIFIANPIFQYWLDILHFVYQNSVNFVLLIISIVIILCWLTNIERECEKK